MWTFLVNHHRKFLSDKGLKEEADRTAAYLKSSDEVWRKYLNDASEAIERFWHLRNTGG